MNGKHHLDLLVQEGQVLTALIGSVPDGIALQGRQKELLNRVLGNVTAEVAEDATGGGWCVKCQCVLQAIGGLLQVTA